MQIEKGSLLISTTVSGGDMFERSVILIAEKNEFGYIGFILNKPFPRKLNELAQFSEAKALQLFTGGPVDTENMFFIHAREDMTSDSSIITENVFLDGDFVQIIDYISDGTVSENEVKIFVGYCGWDVQQLADEVAQGWWLIKKFDHYEVFDSDYKNQWSRLFADNNRL